MCEQTQDNHHKCQGFEATADFHFLLALQSASKGNELVEQT